MPPILETWNPISVAVLIVGFVYLLPLFVSRMMLAVKGQPVPPPGQDFTAIVGWLQSHENMLEILAKTAVLPPAMAAQLQEQLRVRQAQRQASQQQATQQAPRAGGVNLKPEGLRSMPPAAPPRPVQQPSPVSVVIENNQ